MGKSRRGSTVEHVSVRMTKAEIERIDALIERCSTSWRQATRSDVMRFLLIQGLECVEKGDVVLVPVLRPSKEGEGSG
jgi:hypothetical protein